ncbi:MAG: maleylacetoacetate isomerase [Alphaproteobacteria bacterium]|nr:maleylacetoacetate isomerase [Alphaproteobacteria bacterium]
MKFYDFYMSNAAYRVRIALKLKGLEAEQVIVNLIEDEHRANWFEALNPQRMLPILEDGGIVVAQSLPILEYLEEVYPEPPLLPANTAGRAWVRSFAQSIASDMHPLMGRRVRRYLADRIGASAEDIDGWYRNWIAAGLSGLEGMLAARESPGGFCSGDAPTLADLCLVPQTYNARRFNRDLSPYPTILDIVARCNELPAFADSMPENQPDWKPMEGVIPGGR